MNTTATIPAHIANPYIPTPVRVIAALAALGLTATFDNTGGGVYAVTAPLTHPDTDAVLATLTIGNGDWNHTDATTPADTVDVLVEDLDGDTLALLDDTVGHLWTYSPDYSYATVADTIDLVSVILVARRILMNAATNA